jgi:hypothetical protein
MILTIITSQLQLIPSSKNLIKYVKYTGCYGSPRPPIGLVKITFFLFIIFPQILPNKVKIKYNLDPKIHTRSCVYTSINNEARKKNYSTKILE